ncbi:MAG: hypothetical protein M0Z40_02435 [Actinomycetota bacterium]|jgi:hypothetical protein|nr:hypothetical protein [Actinomycetota bacterium]
MSVPGLPTRRWGEADQDLTRYLVLGPDRAGNLLEAEAMRPASGQRVRAS